MLENKFYLIQAIWFKDDLKKMRGKAFPLKTLTNVLNQVLFNSCLNWFEDNLKMNLLEEYPQMFENYFQFHSMKPNNVRKQKFFFLISPLWFKEDLSKNSWKMNSNLSNTVLNSS